MLKETEKLEEKQGEFGEDFVNKVKAECLFIRGFYLFQLGKEFKNAPLRLTASQSPSTFPLEKSSQAEIWSQAEQDLLTAASLLPVKNDVIGKPTKGAAYAVLGKIYVYEEDFDKAIEILEPLTKSPYTYRLVEDFAWNFDDVHDNQNFHLYLFLPRNNPLFAGSDLPHTNHWLPVPHILSDVYSFESN